MRKNYLFTLIILFAIIKLHAQTTTLLTGIEKPTDLIVDADNLYYIHGSFNPSPFGSSIPRTLSTYNLTTATTNDLLELSGSYSLLLENDTTLFISGNAGIYKTNLMEFPLLPTQVIAPVGSEIYRGMEKYGDDIYIITRNHGIFSFNKNTPTPSLTTVTNPIGAAYDIEIIDSFLFIADYGANQISKINLNETFPAIPVFVASINKPVGLDYWNEKLYVSSETTNAIYNFDPYELNPNFNTILNIGLGGPDIGLAFDGNTLYIPEYGSGEISKYALPIPALTTIINSNASCNGNADGGASAIVSGGTPPYTYVWNNGDTTASLVNIPAGTYTVTISDNNEYTTVDSITVTEPQLLAINLIVDSNATCYEESNGGATAIVSGGTPPYTYLWSNGDTTASITGVPASGYGVSVTDANGCYTHNFTTISEPYPSYSYQNIKASGSYEWINGVTYTENTYGVSDTLTNMNGCDSIVTLYLTLIDYCSSRSTRNRFEWIKQVELGTEIDNLTNQDANGFGDYTDQLLTVDTGDVVTVNLTPGYRRRTYVEYWRIWADWNFDGDFNDPGENVFEQKGKNIRTGSFTIPANVEPYELGLRVSMRWKRYAPACGNFSSGEVEDYKILVNHAQGSPYAQQEGKLQNPENQNSEEFSTDPLYEFTDVYPNPVMKGNMISGYLRTEKTGTHQIYLSNTLGQVIKTQTIVSEYEEYYFEISTEGLTTGLYFMNINRGNETVKIMIK